MLDILKTIILGIVEGITEWLPISSTGHLILFKEFMGGSGFMTDATFFDLYLYIIQLGAILAVVTIYFKKLNPFSQKTKKERTYTWQMWLKVIMATLPAAVIGLVLDDFMEMIETPYVVAAMLIIYGIAFIVVENRRRTPSITTMNEMTYKTALMIGAFQVLSIIPGTSRSGATILGAIIIGCSRGLAAEFSFFLAIPVMFGVSILKVAKYAVSGAAISGGQIAVIIIGMAVAYFVSMLAIRFLVGYVKKHDFKPFGWYRIILGILVILYFAFVG